MLVTEELTDNRVRHFSSEKKYIRQRETGVLYEDAVDARPLRYSYEETNELIPDRGEEASSEDYEAALNRLGAET